MSAQISPLITYLPIVPKAGLAILASLSFALQPAYADEIQAGRYSVISLLPTSAQRDPLSSVVDTTLSDAVTSIGEALEILLAGSGYRLSAPNTAPAIRETLLALPLPGAHRKLGPLPLREALQVLAGPAFVLVEDPIHRLVSFEPCSPTAFAPSQE